MSRFYKNLRMMKKYSNGQLAVFIHDQDGEPIAELSVYSTIRIKIRNCSSIGKTRI